MCGIAGVYHFNQEYSIRHDSLVKMLEKIKHRGPDSSGIEYVNSSCAFMHSRLAIIDVTESSHQPYVTKSGSILNYNGEIYNFKELQKLVSLPLERNSDTSTLAMGLCEHGIDFTKNIDGMFAFSFWSTENNALYIARDYFGIKPLYYYKDNDKFIFASEIKAILEYPEVNKTLDQDAINEFFQLGYILDPDTGFKHIKQLKAGHCLKITNEAINEYTLPESKLHSDDLFLNNLKLSIKRRLTSDVPITTLYSGGIDSSLIAQEIPSHISLSHLDLISTNYSESQKAILHASYLDKTIDIIQSSSDINLKNIVYYADDLIADPALVSNFLLYQEISKKYKVGIQGDGADELFWGYFTHTAVRLANFKAIRFFIPCLNFILLCLNKLPTQNRYSLSMKITRFLKAFKQGFPYVYLLWRSPFLGNIVKTSYNKKYTLNKLNKLLPSKFQNPLDIDFYTYMISNILKKVDRMSMAFGYEVRVPFLSTYVVHSANKIKPSKRSTFFKRKKYLLTLFQHKKILKQKKSGFGFDLVKLMKNEDYRDFLLSSDSHVFNHFIDHEKLMLLLEKKCYDYDTSYQIFTLLVFKYWLQNYNISEL